MTATSHQVNFLHKNTVRNVYREIADTYDRRIPGESALDDRFTGTEFDFVLSRVQPGQAVLDLGCGTGRFSIPLARTARVTGLDLTEEMLDAARSKAKNEGLSVAFEQGDMAELPFADESFDVVVSMLALMHVPEAQRGQVFAEISRVLRPGGRALLGVKNSVFERFSSADRFAEVDITDVDTGELVFTQTGHDNDLRAPWRSFSPGELRSLGAINGLIPTSLIGNIPISVWLDSGVVNQGDAGALISTLERRLSDIAPFNELGYHLLFEAVRPR